MASSKSRLARGTRKRAYKKYKRTSYNPSHKPSATEFGLMGSLVGSSALTQGVEINSGSFQEQQDLFMGGGKGRRHGCVNDIADHILSFLELLNTIKIYHWSTLSYPTHKATDELHGKMSELVDSFIEIYIGHCSRGGAGGAVNAGGPVFRFKSGRDASIAFCECKSLPAFCKVLDDNIIHLEGLTKSLDGYTDLVNIRDEMVGALAQTLYLLRLH